MIGSAHAAPFVDASALLLPNPAESSFGCAIGDLDRDGLPEIAVATASGPNRLYKWNGDRLVDVAPPEFADEECSGVGIACGDFDDDGRPDVYILNTSAFVGPHSDPDRLLRNDGGLQFTDVLAQAPRRNVAAGRSVCWFDPHGDGTLGVYVSNYGAPSSLYVRSPRGDIVDIAEELGLARFGYGRSVLAGDILGNGRVCLFAGNENGANRFHVALPGGGFADRARAAGLADPYAHARGAALCDFDRDGRFDLLLGNWEGPNRLLRQEADGRFRDVAPPWLWRPGRVRSVVAFDYDNDGWEDLFFHVMHQPNRLFRNRGDGTFEEVDPGPLALPRGCGTGATCGDLNGDGFLDLFLAHGDNEVQPNALFLNTPNDNRWCRVHVLTAKGAPAIGARVVAFAEGDDRPLLRSIDGGSGYLCQMEPVAHFGIGGAKGLRTIDVRYTDGRVHTLRNVPANSSVFLRPRGATGWQVDVEDGTA